MEYTNSEVLMAYPKTINNQRYFVLESTPGDPGFIVDDARLLWAIQQIPDIQFTKDWLVELWTTGPLNQSEACEIWNLLVELGGILAVDHKISKIPELKHSPASYHNYSRNYPFMYMAKTEALWDDNGLMIEYSKESKMPDVWMELPSKQQFKIKKAESILKKIVNRQPSQLNTTLDKIGFISDFCLGARFKGNSGFNKDLHFLQLESLSKTIPSGGGKHPTELFIVATGIDDIKRGVYHYNVKENRLDLLEAQLTSLLPLLDATHELAIGYFLIVSKLERAMWRYREPRSWRAVMIDAGHVVHTLTTLARVFGIRCDRVTDFSAGAISTALGLISDEMPTLAIIRLTGE